MPGHTHPQPKKARLKATRSERVQSAAQKMPAGERLAYSVREVAALLGRDVSTIYQVLRAGHIKYKRLPGGTMFITRDALQEYLNDSNSAA